MKQILILATAVVGFSAPAALADCMGHVSASMPVDKELTTASIVLPENKTVQQTTATTVMPVLPEDKTTTIE